jgi:hypothetical protein
MDLRKLRCYVAYMVSFEKRFSSFHANTKCRRVKNDFVSETFVEVSGFSVLLKQILRVISRCVVEEGRHNLGLGGVFVA